MGKSKPKATTTTDTSFKAKAVVLPQQAIVRDQASDAAFEHFLSLTKHHNSDSRKEALVQIQTHVHAHTGNLRPVFQATAPLILDESKKVRDTVEQLYRSTDVSPHLASHSSLVMLYVQSAMTNITPEIRSQSTNFLTLLLEAAPREVARLAWTRTVSNFFPLLGWPVDSTGAQAQKLASATVTTGLSFGSSASKTKLAHITALKTLLTTCLDPELDSDGPGASSSVFHPDTARFLLPATNLPFAGLDLFPASVTKNASQDVTEDVDSRWAFLRPLVPSLRNGLNNAVKEAGQVGRVAASILAVLDNMPAAD